jgi:hypothetical protein
MIFTDLYDAANNDGLFDILGKIFHAIDTLNTARGTTVPTEVEDVLSQFKLVSGGDLDLQQAIDEVASGTDSWQESSTSLASVLQVAAQNYLMEIVKADSQLPPSTLDDCLGYLVDEMERLSAFVESHTVTLTLTEDPDAITNVGDPAILYTELRGDGRNQANALAETIDLEVTEDSSATQPTITFAGERQAPDRLNHQWPMGSGIDLAFTAADPASSLLSNGDFEDTTVANIPDDWVVVTGSPGNTIAVSVPEVQTVTIAGTPTGGSYVLHWVDTQGIQRSTDTLAHNASASAVQSGLRAITGLESVTVSATGTGPNFTHTVTFAGVAGNVNQLTSTNNLLSDDSSPTIAHATTVDGNDGAYKGRALGIIGDGSELTELYHPLLVSEETVYFCHCRIRKVLDTEQSSSSSSSGQSSSSSTSSSSSSSSSTSSGHSSSSSSTAQTSSSSSTENVSTSSSSSESSESSLSTSSSSSSTEQTSSSSSSGESSGSSSSSSQAGEELRIEIVEGTTGPATADSDGNTNELRINVGTVSTDTHDSQFFSFRLPRDVVQPIYLRIRLTNALPLGTAIWIDEMVVVEAEEIYDGGPFVAAVSGVTAAVVEDNWSLAVANDRGGAPAGRSFQEWFHRCFDMAGKGLLLPVSGSNSIPDTIIG